MKATPFTVRVADEAVADLELRLELTRCHRPLLAGFGCSPAPVSPGTSSRAVASLWHMLMAELGHSSYFAQGGDIGSGVSTWLARLYPDAVRATSRRWSSPGHWPVTSMRRSQRFAERSSVARAPKCRRYVRPSTETPEQTLLFSRNQG
jgi:pimeloyl-ACP methyl ester carboxylesterase